jgi:hypothetical protein
MSRGLTGKFVAIAAGLVFTAALLSVAGAGAKSTQLHLTGVVVKSIPPIKVGNGPRTISTLYQGKTKVGKLNLGESDCSLQQCVEGGYAHIKGFKLKGEKSGTLYVHLINKATGFPPKPAKSATGTVCVAQSNHHFTTGCTPATLTPGSVSTVGTNFKLVVG